MTTMLSIWFGNSAPAATGHTEENSNAAKRQIARWVSPSINFRVVIYGRNWGVSVELGAFAPGEEIAAPALCRAKEAKTHFARSLARSSLAMQQGSAATQWLAAISPSASSAPMVSG